MQFTSPACRPTPWHGGRRQARVTSPEHAAHIEHPCLDRLDQAMTKVSHALTLVRVLSVHLPPAPITPCGRTPAVGMTFPRSYRVCLWRFSRRTISCLPHHVVCWSPGRPGRARPHSGSTSQRCWRSRTWRSTRVSRAGMDTASDLRLGRRRVGGSARVGDRVAIRPGPTATHLGSTPWYGST
jgi:hypothetical protein